LGSRLFKQEHTIVDPEADHMDRVRCVCAHLLPQPVASEAATDEPKTASLPSFFKKPTKVEINAMVSGLTEEERWKALQTLVDYREGADQLMKDGKMPSLSIFDMLMVTKHEVGVPQKDQVNFWLDEALQNGSLKALDLLPGPWQDAKTRADQIELIRLHQLEQVSGRDVFLYAHWQMQYGDRGLSSNIVAPKSQSSGAGSGTVMRVIPRVIVADPEDAERISRTHVRKEGNFEQVLYDSVISTTDNEHWKAQRQHLTEVFLPMSSLAQIMPVSLQRAKHCANRLASMAASTAGQVDMSDFLLHEAQAQLQLALLGAPDDLMNATNAEIRAAFMGDATGRVGALGDAMKALMQAARSDTSLAVPSDGCPVRGPLSRAVQASGLSPSADYGNMLLILFAGHDTTGHTMTWLLFEIARHPEIQRKLHKEADDFFKSLGNKDLKYQDLGAGLDLLDRCVTETLRLWPAVASGTYRQLQFDDTVRGPGGVEVTLPSGTPVNIVNWSRHRNPAVWGPDADEFNPYRNFTDEELARVGCPLAATTPQSARFSPFAHNPRSCLGKNFAQMEMRLILVHLLNQFEFSLAPPFDQLMGVKLGATPGVDEFHGLNRATMGPKDPSRSTRHSWGDRYTYAMNMCVKARSESGKCR